MLTVTAKAAAYIKEKGGIINLELPPIIDCCIHLREAPMINIGVPPKPDRFEKKVIDGIEIYFTDDLPDLPLTIDLSNFLGFKRLVIEGWKLA